jgi:hypothetical protein
MDPQAGSSFIPKKPLDSGVRRGAGSTFGLFFLLALLIFIGSLVAAASAFLYKGYLQNQLVSKSDSLSKSQSAYDPAVIQDLQRLDSRMNQAQTLANKHTAASALFSFLSNQTLQNVSFSSFDYTLQPDGSANISLNGHANSFPSVALQSDQFGASKMLKNVVFSGIGVNSGGGVDFAFAATVDPSLMLYSNSLLGASAAASPTASSSTP